MDGQGTRRGARQRNVMLHLDGLEPDSVASKVTPVDLAGGEGAHDEAWLQRLTHRFPEVLPVHDLEPGFGRLVAVCRELPVRTGFVDNLYVTGDGNLVLVECKLWRNPQARREVVAQIIDYAHCLAGWTYEDLERAVRQARQRDGSEASGLHALVEGDDALPEAAFVDAVSRTLRLGRFLLIVLGDGIHESAETLADYLQEHAGFHFTLGLVEARVHTLPGERGYVVQPRVLARTLNIERGIVRVEDGALVVAPVPAPAAGTGSRGRPTSDEPLFEALKAIDAALPERLQAFADELADLGVALEPDGKSLVLRWSGDCPHKLDLGRVYANGEVLTMYANHGPNKIGRVDLGHVYQEDVAKLIEGSVQKTPKNEEWYAVIAGTRTSPALATLLDRSDGWRAAIERLVEGFRKALMDADGA